RNHPDFANSALQVCHFDSGGVHFGSGVPNHAFAMLTDGKSFNGFSVTGIGPIKAGAIWYRALTVYLTPASDFADSYDALLQAGADLIGFDPNDPRNGLPSGSPITAADIVELDEALLAVELNTEGTCGETDPGLDGAPAIECGGSTVIFSDDFEGGVNGWTVSNTVPPTPYDWVQVADLPKNRPGTAWFVDDADIGNCGSIDESAVHSLFSPAIPIPAGSDAPYLSFAHFFGTEGGFDAGNLKLSVNSGPWTVVPRTAYDFNAHNGRANTLAQDNTNPLAGEGAWTGLSKNWGTSVVNLTGLVVVGDVVQLRFDFGKDGCAGTVGWYIDDVRLYSCPDCDDSGAADIDEVQFAEASPLLGPIGSGSPQAHTLVSPPAAGGDVTIRVHARGDFLAANEYMDLTLNGTPIDRLLEVSAGRCPGNPDFQRVIVSSEDWNALVPGGNAVLAMTATSAVNAGGSCGSSSYVLLTVNYAIAGSTDCNFNGSLDGCELSVAGIAAFVDSLLGNAPFTCVFDLFVDGEIDGRDIQPVVDTLLEI
ncbi:MAG TPA: M4 family metallopeptidase, partial [Phycisphaerae bacterium]|nr:M4 family metallopeptidase [Phycisphaerae bacterium]